MPLTKRYSVANGQILKVKEGATSTLLMSDTLGNVVETRDMVTGAQLSETTYWPYGEIRTQTGTNTTPWGFCGTWGYYTASGQATYVRARYYRPHLGRWQTVDPLWPTEEAYTYVETVPLNSADPSGRSASAIPVFPGGRNYGCTETPCCEYNTRYWINECKKTGNRFACCAKEVSRFICDTVNAAKQICDTCTSPVMIGLLPSAAIIGINACDLANRLDCQNSCMRYNHQIRLNPGWRLARRVCAIFGEQSRECCEASFRAEQREYETCARSCFPGLNVLPHHIRVRFGLDALKCCD